MGGRDELSEPHRASRDNSREVWAAAGEQLEHRLPRDSSLGVHLRDRRRWWHRHLDSAERRRVMAELGITRQAHWAFRFATMLTLSVVVAVMGLSTNSAALVIGAMLLAPLMQPVLATAACVAMALFRNSLRSFAAVVLATAWAIALSYGLATVLVNGQLPDEVTSRTAPDIRDLIVALAAGTAGAYATVRKDVSSSLPGVAVAVALVPPLAVVGISLEAGNGTFAWGAMLLYTTNLFAIMLAGALVFVVTGFVPPRRLATTLKHSSMAAATIGLIVVAIAIPLYGASTSAVERSEREVEALEAVSSWLGPVGRRSPPQVAFDGSRITVSVRSFDSPPDPDPLTKALLAAFGDDRIVSIERDRVDQATTTTTAPQPTTVPVSDEEARYTSVQAIVDRWLAGFGPDAAARRDVLSVVDDVVRLDASGTTDAPAIASLTDLLDAELGQTFRVQLTWLRRENITDQEPVVAPEQLLHEQIEALARAWAEARAVDVVSTTLDGQNAIIELAGPEAPDATGLVRQINSELAAGINVTVYFVERRDITTLTTTTTSTSTAPPTTSPDNDASATSG